MMKLLSLDTSTKTFSLAVTENAKVLASVDVVLEKVLSDSIVPAIAGILKKCKLSLQDLDGFVVGLGPGSFTSLRVGLATFKALCFVNQKPIVGIPSLDAIALSVNEEISKVAVIQDARRSLIYAAVYEKEKDTLKLIGDYQLITLNDWLAQIPVKDEIFMTGDAVPIYKEKIHEWGKANHVKVFLDENPNRTPQAKDLALLSHKRFQSKKFVDVSKIVPLYLYPADCQVTR